MTGSNMKLLVVIICTTIICVACEQEYEVQEVSSVELFCESNSDCVVRMCGCDWVCCVFRYEKIVASVPKRRHGR